MECKLIKKLFWGTLSYTRVQRSRTAQSIKLLMNQCLVNCQCISCGEYFPTKAARNRYPLQVVGFNVIAYLGDPPLFSTDFANVNFLLVARPIRSLFPSENWIISFLHHRIHLFLKSLQFATILLIR